MESQLPQNAVQAGRQSTQSLGRNQRCSQALGRWVKQWALLRDPKVWGLDLEGKDAILSNSWFEDFLFICF